MGGKLFDLNLVGRVEASAAEAPAYCTMRA